MRDPRLRTLVLSGCERGFVDERREGTLRARLCETRLLFVASALKQLFGDPGLLAIMQTAKLATLPQFLAEHVGRKGA